MSRDKQLYGFHEAFFFFQAYFSQMLINSYQESSCSYINDCEGLSSIYAFTRSSNVFLIYSYYVSQKQVH